MERINEILSRLDVLQPKAESNTLSVEERAEVLKLSTELETLEAEERAISAMKERKLQGAKKAAKDTKEALAERFSLFKVARAVASNKPFTGAEAEVHQEGLEEAREHNQAVIGFALPSFANTYKQQRYLAERAPINTGSAPSAGNLVATDLYDMVPALRPMVKLASLGANLWTGLVGNIDIPAGDLLATASFNTQMGAALETVPTIKKVTLTPKRLAAYTDITLQMIHQSSYGVENYVVEELVNAEARKIDEVAILGGGANEPTGLLGIAGTNIVSLGTNGANITRDKLIQLETLLSDANADEGTMAFLSTPGVKGFLKNLISSSGVGPFVWQDDNTVLGYNAVTSNLVPKTLTKGTSNNCHAVIFGNFKRLIIGNWGVRDITIDPYTQKTGGSVRIVINSYWDTAVVHPKGFSMIKDAII
jgi:HK97 family phage major capsid protein